MDYIDRLIQRALAQPRGAEAALFDPFERQAGWPLDARPVPASVPSASSAPAHEVAAPDSAHPAVPRTTPAIVGRPPAAFAPPRVPGASSPTPATATAVDAPTPATPAPVRAADVPRTTPPHSAESLARADAFMRTLGVPGVPAAPLAHATEAPSQAAALAPVTRARPAAPDTPAPARTSAPARLQPPAPPPVASLPAPTRAAQPPAPPPGSAATAPARTPRRETPVPVLQTTLVVAPPARALDDLAHSAGIVGFGLGQL